MIEQLSTETMNVLQSLAEQQGISVADYLSGLIEKDKESKEIVSEKLYSTNEAARKLGLSYNKTLHLCQEGALEYARTDGGGRYKIYGWSLIEYRDRYKVDPKEWISLDEVMEIVNPNVFSPYPKYEKKGEKDYVKRTDFKAFIQANIDFWSDVALKQGLSTVTDLDRINEDDFTDTSNTPNFVEVQGLLKKAPTLKTSTGGKSCCNFGIWRWSRKGKKWTGGYISCFMFGAEAIHFATECEQKMKSVNSLAVLLRGKLQPSNFKRENEETRYNVQVNVSEYQIVDKEVK